MGEESAMKVRRGGAGALWEQEGGEGAHGVGDDVDLVEVVCCGGDGDGLLEEG